MLFGGISMYANDLTSLLALSGLITEVPDNPTLFNIIKNLPEIINEIFKKFIK